MLNLFKKSYKSRFAAKLGKATQHKMFTNCEFKCSTSDSFINYSCDIYGDYLIQKLGGEPYICRELEITCEKDDSSNNDSNLIKLIIPFSEDFSPFLDEELEAACQAHKTRKKFAAVTCQTTACDVRVPEEINGLILMISDVNENNFDEKLELLLDAVYTLLENM